MFRNKVKIISFIIVLGMFFSFSVPAANAAAGSWPDLLGNLFGSFSKNMMEVIASVARGAMKTAALKLSEKTVSNLIGGSSGEALIIDDWTKVLSEDPVKKADAYIEGLFSSVTKGKSSSSNYSSAKEGVIGNYTSSLVEQARGVTTKSSMPETDIQEYTPDPSTMLNGGSWGPYLAFMDPEKNNNGLTTKLNFAELYQQRIEQEKDEAGKKAVAYGGYKAQESGGKVVTPGSTIRDIEANNLDFGNKIVAGANSMAEIATALMIKIVSNTVKNGIGKIKQNIQKEATNTVGRYSSDFSKQIPTKLFKPSY